MPRQRKQWTTRHERFLSDRDWYRRLAYEYWHWFHRWKEIGGHSVPIFRKLNHQKRGRQVFPLRTGRTFSHGPPAISLPGYNPLLNSPGPMNPPHVGNPHFLPPPAWEAGGWHLKYPMAGYHRRTVTIFKKRARDPRWTPFNLQVSGCNYFYFRQQYYKDTDVLSRHPNETDVGNGAPLGPPGWPSPLGYQ